MQKKIRKAFQITKKKQEKERRNIINKNNKYTIPIKAKEKGVCCIHERPKASFKELHTVVTLCHSKHTPIPPGI